MIDTNYKPRPRDITKYHYSKVSGLSPSKLSELINVPIKDIIIYGSWYLINGEYYYFKYDEVLVEILINSIYNHLGISVPELIPAYVQKYNRVEGYITKNLRHLGHTYEEYDTFIDRVNKSFVDRQNNPKIDLLSAKKLIEKSSINGEELYKELSSLHAADYFTGQNDRSEYNLIIDSHDGKSHLMPITDNGVSFHNPISEIVSCLGNNQFVDKIVLQDNLPGIFNTLRLIMENDSYRNTLIKCLDTDTRKIILRTLKEYRIRIEQDKVDSMVTYFDEKKKHINRTLNVLTKL